MKVGVLALQGDFREHKKVLEEIGTSVNLVRRPEDLDAIDGLIIPGGESTTISKLLRKWDLFEPIRREAKDGFPIFGTCAGLILLAREVHNGPPTLELMDITLKRNAYGRQIESFESELEFESSGEEVTRGRSITGVFIRAPQVTRVGPNVEKLANHEGLPVLVREDNLLGATFHPELTDNYEIHEYFLTEIVNERFD
ncbi:MAG: pyridoxal 5'-phosphate synthase glutaminase subunit PdxT [Candidatus Bipolaricaulia bacterium]